MPSVARAELPPGVTCSLINGVYVCTDGSAGDGGSICLTDSSGNKSCVTNGGGDVGSGPGASLGGDGLGRVLPLPSQVTGTGWLSRLTGWVSYAIHTVFVAVAQLLKDLVTYVLAVILSLVATAIESISPPSWLSQYSMGTMLGNAGPIVGFFLSQLRIPEALALIGAGYAFRLLRKFLTLFQW